MTWETVIGLEVHVQLATRSKLFCDCSTVFGDDPNANVCPVCLGLPGALPVTNREAVRLGVRAALALGFAVHRTSLFARKNYFYPDLPKGYQISQFDQPLASRGALEIESADRGDVSIGLTRLHLEEDAGKSLHDRFPDQTALDFNRSGIPLAEIVSDPDLRSPAEARAYLTTLKQILQYLDVSDCSMEEGRLRVDANLSVRSEGQEALGVKQEIKNMNSFATVERSLDYLRLSQIQTLEDGATVEPNTFSAATGTLRVMRTKEASHDYRYFPEPDLPPLEIGRDWLDEERNSLPELPRALCARLGEQYGVPSYDAGVLASTRALADYFEQLAGAGVDGRTAAHWVMGSVLQDANENKGVLRVAPTRLAALIHMVGNRQVSLQTAKRLFPELAVTDEAPETLAARLEVIQIDDEDQLSEWVRTVIETHPDELSRFREGESKLMDFFMGRVMKTSRGKADPKRVQQMLLEELGR
ncbi:MAG: Asp-tRNA(Asn)/Glu-tRNA(Gln) amidotransferase subunit GatB [Gemmatimonadetes bacterium]|nr:Asp-tRNA(Asn)/Glu-tRNA(Gln) amidotransferase subunit GatB [Gemmatimonadota bacterium]